MGFTRMLPRPREGIIGILAMERCTCVLVGGREDTGITPSFVAVLSQWCYRVVTVLLQYTSQCAIVVVSVKSF
jgi:hypothetical protein